MSTLARKKQQLMEASSEKLRQQQSKFAHWKNEVAEVLTLRDNFLAENPMAVAPTDGSEGASAAEVTSNSSVSPPASSPSPSAMEAAANGGASFNSDRSAQSTPSAQRFNVNDLATPDEGCQELVDAYVELDNEIDDIVAIAPESLVVPTILFAKVRYLVVRKKYKEGLETAQFLHTTFPKRCEGMYAKAIVLEQTGKKAGALQAAQRGRNIAGESTHQLPDSETAKAITELMERFALHIKGKGQEGMRENLKFHGERYHSFKGGTCKKCGTEYTMPTPQWMCAKCWPVDEILIWEPDAGACCYVCKEKLKMFRRHHCRCCGHAVCSQCSQKEAKVTSLKYLSPTRVCDICYPLLTRPQQSPRALSISIPQPQQQ